MPYYQRKYVDLIRQVSSKWVNWDPPIPVEVRRVSFPRSIDLISVSQVGAFGEVESETGELRVDGNVYDPDFQAELNKLGLSLRMADHPPQEGGDEEDVIISSKGARRVDVGLGPEVCVVSHMPPLAF